MERKLGGFAHGPDEQEKTDGRNGQPARSRNGHGRQLFTHIENILVIQRTGKSENQSDSDNESEVTYPVDQKGFQSCRNGSRFFQPEPDQKIGHHTDRFPAEKELDEIIAHHQRKHGEREQGNI